MRIIIDHEEQLFSQPMRLDALPSGRVKKPLIAKVNDRLRELSYTLTDDATVEFLDVSHPEGQFVYEATLRYLVAMAIDTLFPGLFYKFNFSVSRSTYCHVPTLPQGLKRSQFIEKITAFMDHKITLNLPIERVYLSLEDVKEIYLRRGWHDKLESLRYRPEAGVHLYQCDGYLNYMYHHMAPTTGVIEAFHLRAYAPGFLIQYPRSETGGMLPPFGDQPIFSQVLREASDWGLRIEAQTIAQINRYVDEKQTAELVQLNESKHNQMIAQLGHIIENDRHNIRLIAIAGPSSSGKTTFSTRLRIELITQGLKPIMISLDDYYLDREYILPNEDGIIDLEHIETLDIALLNENLRDLIAGQTVALPRFDFTLKKRVGYRNVTVEPNQPIIIEGIHALNPRLTELVTDAQVYRIFIAPMLQINQDWHNPISLTNLRLLRRIVRDQKYRNASAEKTITMWPSVRQGEFKWIYPFQERAHYIYNSGLLYEFGVLKPLAMASLEKIAANSEHYITANRLMKFLKYFMPIDEKHVPCNSLLREFIGDSCFSFE